MSASRPSILASDRTARVAGLVFLFTLAISTGLGFVFGEIGRWAPSDAKRDLVQAMLGAQAAALGPLISLPAVMGALTNLVLPIQMGTTGAKGRPRILFSVLCQIVAVASCFASVASVGTRWSAALFAVSALAGSAGLAATSVQCLSLFSSRPRPRRAISEGTTVLASSLYMTSVASLFSCAAVVLLHASGIVRAVWTGASLTTDAPVFPAGLLLVPAIGIVSDILATFTRRRIASQRLVVWFLAALAYVAFACWALRWFGGSTVAQVATWVTGPVFAAFGGVVVVAWLATLRGAGARIEMPMAWAAAFIAQLVVGLFAGFAIWPGAGSASDPGGALDSARAHYLYGGAPLFAVTAGLMYWFPRVGNAMPRGARLGLALAFAGYQVGFVAEIVAGLFELPRGLATRALGLAQIVDAAALSAVALGFLLVAVDLVAALRRSVAVEPNPWASLAPEWRSAESPRRELGPYDYHLLHEDLDHS